MSYNKMLQDFDSQKEKKCAASLQKIIRNKFDCSSLLARLNFYFSCYPTPPKPSFQLSRLLEIFPQISESAGDDSAQWPAFRIWMYSACPTALLSRTQLSRFFDQKPSLSPIVEAAVPVWGKKRSRAGTLLVPVEDWVHLSNTLGWYQTTLGVFLLLSLISVSNYDQINTFI